MKDLYFKKVFRDHKGVNIALFIALSIFLIYFKFTFHELWKDEWQAWLVTRDMSLFDVLGFLHYEGHPSLWYLYLKFWTLLPIQDVTCLHIAHSVLLLLTLYWLYLKVSLPTIVKLAISMSYFIVFEYGIIDRGYILVILLSLIIVESLSKQNYSWKIGLCLMLLCQTEAYGVIIAGSLLLYILLNSEGKIQDIKSKISLIFFSLIGFILFVITVFPRGFKDDFTRAYNQDIFSLDTVFTSFQGHLANVFAVGAINDTASNGNSVIGVILSVIILFFIIHIFRDSRRVFYSFFFGFIGFLIFSIVIFSGGLRQWGMVYILFILYLILYYNTSKNHSSQKYILIILMMIFPIIHGVRGLVDDYRLPFSNAAIAGQFIKDKIPKEVPIVVINKFETTPVAGYAGRQFYELPDGSAFTYFKWLEKVYIPTQEELTLFTKFKNVGGIVLLSPTPIDTDRFPKAQFWIKFDQDNFKRENYWIYSVPLQ